MKWTNLPPAGAACCVVAKCGCVKGYRGRCKCGKENLPCQERINSLDPAHCCANVVDVSAMDNLLDNNVSCEPLRFSSLNVNTLFNLNLEMLSG